jgi:hypothetical protein
VARTFKSALEPLARLGFMVQLGFTSWAWAVLRVHVHCGSYIDFYNQGLATYECKAPLAMAVFLREEFYIFK